MQLWAWVLLNFYKVTTVDRTKLLNGMVQDELSGVEICSLLLVVSSILSLCLFWVWFLISAQRTVAELLDHELSLLGLKSRNDFTDWLLIFPSFPSFYCTFFVIHICGICDVMWCQQIIQYRCVDWMWRTSVPQQGTNIKIHKSSGGPILQRVLLVY